MCNSKNYKGDIIGAVTGFWAKGGLASAIEIMYSILEAGRLKPVRCCYIMRICIDIFKPNLMNISFYDIPALFPAPISLARAKNLFSLHILSFLPLGLGTVSLLACELLCT